MNAGCNMFRIERPVAQIETRTLGVYVAVITAVAMAAGVAVGYALSNATARSAAARARAEYVEWAGEEAKPW